MARKFSSLIKGGKTNESVCNVLWRMGTSNSGNTVSEIPHANCRTIKNAYSNYELAINTGGNYEKNNNSH